MIAVSEAYQTLCDARQWVGEDKPCTIIVEVYTVDNHFRGKFRGETFDEVIDYLDSLEPHKQVILTIG